MSIWKEIKKSVNSDLKTPLDVTLGKRSDPAGGADEASLMSREKQIWNTISIMQTEAGATAKKVDGILALVARGVVKSVQRGTSVLNPNNDSTRTIPISAVTPSKCTVSIFGAGTKSGSIDAASGNIYRESAVYVSSLSANALTVGVNAGAAVSSAYGAAFSWEIVEFY